jgi:hypothetical protein
MAVWQYDLWIVPFDRMIELFGAIPDYIDLDTFEELPWWENKRLPDNYEKLLSNFLPKLNESWMGKDNLFWGDIDGNLVNATFLEDKVEEIFVRIDAREICYNFLNGIVDFANDCESIFFSLEEKKPISAYVETLRKHILESRARLFVENPHAFFKRIDKEDFSSRLK